MASKDSQARVADTGLRFLMRSRTRRNVCAERWSRRAAALIMHVLSITTQREIRGLPPLAFLFPRRRPPPLCCTPEPTGPAMRRTDTAPSFAGRTLDCRAQRPRPQSVRLAPGAPHSPSRSGEAPLRGTCGRRAARVEHRAARPAAGRRRSAWR